MKFKKSNKPFIDEDDDECKILDELGKINLLYHYHPIHRYPVTKYINEIHEKFLREGRIGIEQYNKLVEIYEEHCDYEEEDQAAKDLYFTNRREAINLHKEYGHLMPKEYMFFVKEKTVDMKKHKSFSSIDLTSKNAVKLIKNHILSYCDKI